MTDKTEDLFKKIKETVKPLGLEALEGEELEQFEKEMKARIPEVEKRSDDIMKTLEPYEGKYKWLPGMCEISGPSFRGTYEEACRRMVQRGLEWFDHYTEKHPEFTGYSNVYGLINSKNEDAKELERVMLAAADEIDPNGGVTGAMYQASVHSILWVKKNGWDAYVKEMSKEDDKHENNH